MEGYSYHHLETVKEEQTFEDSKIQTEVVTLETDVDDLAAILEQLDASMEYNKDGYSGVLTLDHTTIQTEAAGYTTKYYTITDTKQFTGLDRNDPSYVPTTTVKNGSTLKLSDISWTVTGTGLADDTLVPTSYTATATYTATGSRSVATGYVTTASYTGEIKAEGVEAVKYTVTYLGSPVGFLAGLNPMWLLAGGGLLLLAGTGGIIYIMKRPRAVIYAMNARGVAYKKLGKQKISTRTPKLDLTKLREYPAGDASVELPQQAWPISSGRQDHHYPDVWREPHPSGGGLRRAGQFTGLPSRRMRRKRRKVNREKAQGLCLSLAGLMLMTTPALAADYNF